MNKKNASQIRLYFSALLSRMQENIVYFDSIMIDFKSGTKNFPAKITYGKEGIVLDYQAVKKCTDSESLADFIENEVLCYDEALIVYTERGTRLVVEANNKYVKMRHENVAVKTEPNALSQIGGGRSYVVNPALAKELLSEIGVLAKNGKIKNDKIRKYNQIDYFAQIMGEIIKDVGFKEEFVVLDCACGKSYLSFVLNFYFCEILKKKCRFIGVDCSENVILKSREIADKLGYKNMEFIQADLRDYTFDDNIDVVISLHACDTATDMALALGIRARAKAIVCVPCCHKDILSQYSYAPFEPILKHGILKARMADTLTDGIRSVFLESVGYKVSLIEYISPLETPKNIMIRAVYSGKRNHEAETDYRQLKDMLGVMPAIERFVNK
ncbi:MAG: SAM-dependent methyltransferase [Clostridia bacterium]|nr:SAM-dependent methyltransferase [Clostridia bacterium]